MLAAGCTYSVTHERYSSPSAPGATTVLPDRRPRVGGDIKGASRWASPIAARFALRDATILVAVCNVHQRNYAVFLMPPLPIPLWKTTRPPGPLVVGVELDGRGTWRADLMRLFLVRDHARLPVARWDAEAGGMQLQMSGARDAPCRRAPVPRRLVPERPVELAGPATLWLAFDADSDPDVPGTLSIDGLTVDAVAVELPPLALTPGSRLFTYVNAP